MARRRLITLGAFGLLIAVAIGSLVYLLVLAAAGDQFISTTPPLRLHDATPWLIVAIVAVLLGVGGWVIVERQAATIPDLESERDRARAAEKEAKRRSDELEAERDKLKAAHDRLRRTQETERATVERMAAAWRGEREWNRELRRQIGEMQRQQGTLGRHGDVRKMVLELTLDLVGAEKGLLISSREGADHHREVVCHLGFDHDPQDSAIAQRFAAEVIAADTTIREDDSHRVDSDKRSAADDEVRNLIAIPVYLSDEFTGVIVCANRKDGFESLDDEVLLAVGDHAGAVLQNSRLHGDLRQAYLSTIRVLANAIELKDPELRGHSDAVSEYVMAVADRLDIDAEGREELIFASLLHDVGKLGISERILLKPAELTPEERTVIELHPRIGFELVTQVPALRSIAPAVLHHHERFDGEGYPGRLRGETIPIAARIIAVADSYSAITTDRPYSAARSPQEACEELERCAGGQFDPEVVALFVEEVRRRDPSAKSGGPAPSRDLDVHRAEGEFKLGSRSFALTDSLTLLYSHRHFHESIAAHARRASLQDQPFGVVTVRLEGLGELNRSRGFAAGDAALQSAAAAVQIAAARLTGDAFRVSGRRLAMLVPGADLMLTTRTSQGLEPELRTALAGTGVDCVIRSTVCVPGESAEDVVDRALSADEPTLGLEPA